MKNDSETNIRELRKIKYKREVGINIIKIDPSSCDPLLFKNYLIKILLKLIDIMKFHGGEDLTLSYFKKGKIFHYLFNNWQLLKQLKLESFLLKAFILF